ncbi:S41 family peptidase [Desulfohalobiaceae bacterium Ax17]|uniref:S41 family peptidase n=1 Tax=Desulfovulcanus ferrireducens TaxID=2831190 RepID=UPI00207B9887|nr:S41 family peptidase [Desulfovulcanus ferrireducens]MBT8763895.1 S41 family peptidase [Desulfovulcanus ferrireducens]
MRLGHILGTIVLLVLFSLTPGSSLAKNSSNYEALKRFSQVLHLIEQNYVQKKDRQELIKGAIQGMLQELDPHSSYIDLDEFKLMQEEFSGEFGGIGIHIGMKDKKLMVIAPIEDTPAYKAGLKAGDLILEINGESTQGITLTEAVNKIRGPKGEPVELTILHKDAQKPVKVKIIRDTIPIHSVKSKELEPGYLYLRIIDFKANTTKELKKEIQKYTTKQNLKGIILDLRNNPGGLLDQAVSVSDLFLSDGLIVYTQGRNKESRKEYFAHKQKDDVTCPLIVLINAGSASASEIVAGALKDQKRALLLGEKTFGKGSVQTIIPLSDGSAIKLTVALYYTPKGRSIQAEGVEPDLNIPFEPPRPKDTNNHAFREENLTKHLENPDKKNDKEKEKREKLKAKEMLEKDNQLRMALELVKTLPTIKALKTK